MGLPENISINGYDYDLPARRIAKYPLEERDRSKLLLYSDGRVSHVSFLKLPDLLDAGDRMVFNTTRVIQARLRFRRETGALIEIFCLDPVAPSDYQQSFESVGSVEWRCLVGNQKKWKGDLLKAQVKAGGREMLFTAQHLGRSQDGTLVRFSWDEAVTFAEVIESFGSTPIPPYLDREAEVADSLTYQTVYAKSDGSVAAPTAGLHFTDRILEQVDAKGVLREDLVLHVGAGTFIPVKEKNAVEHSMHAEYVSVQRPLIASLLENTRRTIAVGTTVTRSLESIYWLGNKSLHDPDFSFERLYLDQWDAYEMDPEVGVTAALGSLLEKMDTAGIDRFSFQTRIMIVPGYLFKMVDRLITNFHQPKSTLLLLVAAFVGEDWREIYRYALENEFRFLSYGDGSMLERVVMGG